MCRPPGPHRGALEWKGLTGMIHEDGHYDVIVKVSRSTNMHTGALTGMGQTDCQSAKRLSYKVAAVQGLQICNRLAPEPARQSDHRQCRLSAEGP